MAFSLIHPRIRRTRERYRILLLALIRISAVHQRSKNHRLEMRSSVVVRDLARFFFLQIVVIRLAFVSGAEESDDGDNNDEVSPVVASEVLVFAASWGIVLCC